MEMIIDGRRLILESPTTILEAARRVGVRIPTLCRHPRVSILGACRLCLVEIEGIDRLLAACTTQVSDKMSVLTDTPKLRKVRKTMLEFLLCRHPLDCPTCVKGGECTLQTLTFHYASPRSRFPDNPKPYPISDPSPFVERDPRKCVLCQRCVRVCREVRGVSVLGVMHRGYRKQVGTFFHHPLHWDFQDPYNCEFCGSCIQICPVGALNSKQRKFRARVWEGERIPSVCPFCSVGCLLSLQVKEGELVRVEPRRGPNNQDQACFRGRFGVDHVNGTGRLITPMLRKNGKLIPVERAEGVRALAEKIRLYSGAEALVSSSSTQEEIGAVRKFMATFFRHHLFRAVDTLGLDEADLSPKTGTRGWGELAEADLIFVVGQDFTIFEPVAGVRIRLARQESGSGLVVLDARDTLLGSEAECWLRPPGAALPMVLAGLIRLLVEKHPERLRGRPDREWMDSLPRHSPSELEPATGLPPGSLSDLARRIAEREKVYFMGHRGWHDPEGRVPRLLEELDRLLAGEEARGIAYVRTDCNSRGISVAAESSSPVSGEAPELLLVFGADPLGTALTASVFEARVREARWVVVFDTFLTRTAEAAELVFPLPNFSEKEGTYVAGNGLTQKLYPALPAMPHVPPLWGTLDEIARAAGENFAFSPGGEQSGPEPSISRREEGSPVAALSLPPLPEPERWLIVRGSPLTDHRLRFLPETKLLFPEPAVEVHPSEMSVLDLEEGQEARLVSGAAEISLPVKADPRTPPGQIHLPFDPTNHSLAEFVRAAVPRKGWPASYRLTVIQGLSRAKES